MTCRYRTPSILCLAWALAFGPAQAVVDGAEAAHRAGLQAYHRGDVVAAMAALRPAATAGHGPSQSLLAFLLERADETAEAARLYRMAAAQDDPEGHAGLALLLSTGRGLAKDEKAALTHFSKAAALGHRSSIDIVATAWARRQLGADPVARPAEALAALRRAAEGGHLPSVDELARAYTEGRYGLSPDAAEAARWAERAAKWRRERAAVKAQG